MVGGTIDDAPLSGFHKKLALYAAGGPFLDGYILSIIGVALVQIGPEFGLSSGAEGLLGAAALIGMLFGGLIAGPLTDRFGRQVMYTLDLGLVAILSVAHFFAPGAATLIILRVVIGAAVAADYPMASSLLTEFTPRRWRGPFLSGLVCMFFVGAAVAYLLGNAMLALGPDAWRWMLLSPAVPAVALLILRIGTPESPRWLASQGRHAEAAAVLERVYGDTVDPRDLTTDADTPIRPAALLRGGYLGRLSYVLTFYTCSNIPVFAVYAFGPQILDALGLAQADANVGSAVLSVLFLVGVVTALLVINRTGRRPMVIWGSLAAGLMLLVLGIFPQAPTLVVLLAFAGFSLFNGGPQVLTWVYPNELFPTSVRGTAVGVITALTRIGSAVGVFLVPVSLEQLGIGPTMIAAAALLIIGYAASMKWAPETSHLDLDQASTVPTRSGTPTSERAGHQTELAD